MAGAMANNRSYQFRKDLLHLPGVLGLVLTLSALVLVAMPSETASASNGKPTTRTSYYITTSSTSTAYDHGCNHGAAAAIGEEQVVILDFGGQNSGNTGTLAFGSAGSLTYATIRSIAEQFAFGFWVCTAANTTATVQVALGTNNSVSTPTNAQGTSWASQVNSVQSWINTHAGQAIAYGADDIEPGFGTYPPMYDWVTGFSGHNALFYNFGSADGCPQTTHTNSPACNNGWTQYREWYVSWGVSSGLVIPEIFYNAQANQWEQISLYGSTVRGAGISFSGPGDEYQLDPTTNTAQEAWDDLKAATGQGLMPFSLQINRET